MARLDRLFLALTAPLLANTLAAQPAVVEHVIPRANAFPHDPAVSADGTAWYTDQANSYIGRFDPVTKTFQDWPTPTPGSGPHGICVAPDGYVWYTGQDTGRLGRVDPLTGAITEYVMPPNANRPHTPIAHQGFIWFTAQTNATYGRFDPKTGQTVVYPAPAGSRPYGMFAAPDGSVWIALFGTNRLGRVTTSTGALQLFTLPNSGARPRRLAVGNDGYVWYADHARNYLGRLDPSNGQVKEWPTQPAPYGIALGSDGRVWFHGSRTANMVAFDPRTEQQQLVTIPTNGTIVRHMVVDYPRGKLWLALSGTRRLGEIQLVVPITTYGTACAGSLGAPVVTFAGVPRIGESMQIGVTNSSAIVGALFLGFSKNDWNSVPLPFDLTPFGSAGCSVNASWELLLHAGAPGNASLSVPLDPNLTGGRVSALWALLGDPSLTGGVTSPGAEFVLLGL
jgi:virginiamycin B lyase